MVTSQHYRKFTSLYCTTLTTAQNHGSVAFYKSESRVQSPVNSSHVKKQKTLQQRNERKMFIPKSDPVSSSTENQFMIRFTKTLKQSSAVIGGNYENWSHDSKTNIVMKMYLSEKTRHLNFSSFKVSILQFRVETSESLQSNKRRLSSTRTLKVWSSE